MKKLLLLALVLLGGITQVSAWNYLHGSFFNWTDDAKSCLDSGPVAVYIEASNVPYEFGIKTDNSWFGPDESNSVITGTSTITSFSNSGNFRLTASTSGYYVFSTTWDNDHLTLVVRYPDTKVYFYNALNWSNVYLHDGYWINNNGASNKNALRGIEMTGGENGIYSADIPRQSFYRVTFTPHKQVNEGTNDHGEGYDNFYSTSVVWNANEFDSNKPLYAPTTTVGATINNCSYYYGGDWFSYTAPTDNYTRTVPKAKFGTICLPYAATVTGATVFKIKEKVMDGTKTTLVGLNLESVTTLEAGKAYIFKADNSENTTVTLEATLSGNFTPATLANGMMGNLSSTALTVPADANNYVVGTDNKIHKVVSGGSGITIGQYKAYISLNDINSTNSRGANFIDFNDSETTSIDMVQGEGLTVNGYYNLNGQRVAQPTKGLYIVNGKKVVVK